MEEGEKTKKHRMTHGIQNSIESNPSSGSNPQFTFGGIQIQRIWNDVLKESIVPIASPRGRCRVNMYNTYQGRGRAKGRMNRGREE